MSWQIKPENFGCPLPAADGATVQLAHGGGSRLAAELIEQTLVPAFADPVLSRLEDQAVLESPLGAGERLAFTTDSFVVDPLFFPGGSIGELAINGTINDLAMGGARPLYLSVALIVEEGLELAILRRVIADLGAAAKAAGVRVVTGDTKVVGRGSCDKIFINTSGIGAVPAGLALSAANLQPGDKIIISGTMADHGMAIMSCRQGLSFAEPLTSDTAALHQLTAAIMAAAGMPPAAPAQKANEPEAGQALRAMRDPTRGGVAAVLTEMARASRVGVVIAEETLPVAGPVRGACEILGIDPLFVANEGKLLAVVAPESAGAVLQAMREHPLGRQAAIIGEVVAENPGLVALRTALGPHRIIDLPSGELLPRIC
ncbi:hydrogenase expression/formation protein HypE [Desulfurivibrio alkaliphilus]|uniref:Hydrogenase expression/formation protein HypE n=1 Tax=Desulfurivibrio alkaliphilus (strain DSM 19089 / UNIQEM U267 / AHT2) TaxID=589865 RepID=D6Z6I0_DESAT|nr:hydrogenase expression/formation protein HypE [Desulfurivibrio alkaliphilus]ADH84939.1 hydrogenase expression/formation protein HypE [Desulfurivibrio alkaliphilus AHT 2]